MLIMIDLICQVSIHVFRPSDWNRGVFSCAADGPRMKVGPLIADLVAAGARCADEALAHRSGGSGRDGVVADVQRRHVFRVGRKSQAPAAMRIPLSVLTKHFRPAMAGSMSALPTTNSGRASAVRSGRTTCWPIPVLIVCFSVRAIGLRLR